MIESSQVRHPWRATLRTLIASIVGLLPVLPHIAHEFGWESIPWIATTLTVASAITRILATPQANDWLEKYASWLLPESTLPPFDATNIKKEKEEEDE